MEGNSFIRRGQIRLLLLAKRLLVFLRIGSLVFQHWINEASKDVLDLVFQSTGSLAFRTIGLVFQDVGSGFPELDWSFGYLDDISE
jgi:hypothetical protein